LRRTARAHRTAGERPRNARALSTLLCAALASLPLLVRADALSSAVFVRTDTDHTVVISPRARVEKRVGDATSVDVSYAADVWTSASIDIRASASRPVTEQRDELDFALAHELEDVTLTGSYRYSVENDYESHGATAGGSLDLADKNTTLALNLYGFLDSVGRSGDPEFSRGLGTLGARLSFTQVLDTKTIAQATYEIAHLDGYQASPYRFVGIGGTGFGCLGAVECLAEHEPDARTRHAMAVLLRRALSDQISLGGNYRFFLDSWGLSSHTVAVQLGWTASADTSLALRYRFYTQDGVRFYKPVYETLPDKDQFTTRDREQSPMHDHRIGLDLQQKAAIGGDQGAVLVINAGVGGDFYTYDDFVGLKSTKALELTLALTLER
jgi:hypothetical protein